MYKAGFIDIVSATVCEPQDRGVAVWTEKENVSQPSVPTGPTKLRACARLTRNLDRREDGWVHGASNRTMGRGTLEDVARDQNVVVLRKIATKAQATEASRHPPVAGPLFF